MLFIFRLLPIETIGEQIYDGYATETEEFMCSTEQPACRQQCYNRFHPISHSRLWELQILIIAVPILIFSGVALGVQDKNVQLKEKLKHYEELTVTDLDQVEVTKTKAKLATYSVMKV